MAARRPIWFVLFTVIVGSAALANGVEISSAGHSSAPTIFAGYLFIGVKLLLETLRASNIPVCEGAASSTPVSARRRGCGR